MGEIYSNLSSDEKKRIKNNYTHTDFYGEYGIAFSKEWGEKNNLQPIHYLNEQSQYTRYFSEIVEQVLNTDNVSDAYVDDILDRLCFIKPLRGIMKRKNKKETGEEIEIEYNGKQNKDHPAKEQHQACYLFLSFFTLLTHMSSFEQQYTKMHQRGIEPPHMAPEAIALSTELLVRDF